jgi:hypothetical protein
MRYFARLPLAPSGGEHVSRDSRETKKDKLLRETKQNYKKLRYYGKIHQTRIQKHQ